MLPLEESSVSNLSLNSASGLDGKDEKKSLKVIHFDTVNNKLLLPVFSITSKVFPAAQELTKFDPVEDKMKGRKVKA